MKWRERRSWMLTLSVCRGRDRSLPLPGCPARDVAKMQWDLRSGSQGQAGDEDWWERERLLGLSTQPGLSWSLNSWVPRDTPYLILRHLMFLVFLKK